MPAAVDGNERSADRPNLSKRAGLGRLLTALALCTLPSVPALAQDGYPNKLINVVVPFGPGSGTDVITRLIVDQMARQMKTTIIVLNRAGASGQIGAEEVMRAKPDGYTLLVATNSTHSANPYIFKTLRYDPERDFAPIGRMTINPLGLLVKHDSPFTTAQALITAAKEKPAKITYGYGNTGGQVSAAMLANLAQIDTVPVPYKATPQIFTDLIGGQIDFTFVDLAASKPLIDSGQIKALGVTSPTRFSGLPNVPALHEVHGLEKFSLFAWLGLMAPAKTPPEIVARLNTELRKALDTPEVKKQLQERTSSIVEPTSVPEFTTFLREQRTLWKTTIQQAGIEPQ